MKKRRKSSWNIFMIQVQMMKIYSLTAEMGKNSERTFFLYDFTGDRVPSR